MNSSLVSSSRTCCTSPSGEHLDSLLCSTSSQVSGSNFYPKPKTDPLKIWTNCSDAMRSRRRRTFAKPWRLVIPQNPSPAPEELQEMESDLYKYEASLCGTASRPAPQLHERSRLVHFKSSASYRTLSHSSKVM